jgi:ERCC4-type nuclease
MNIIIDNREGALYNEIIDRDLDKYKDKISITKENLDLGDIHIKFNEIFFIFERKTVTDLLSSINDGRYKEQKARLLSNYNIHSISYIIEGDNVTSTQTYNKNKSVLQGAYISTLFRDNIRVLYTKNISDTTTLLFIIATKMIDNPHKFTAKIDNIGIDYTDTIKMKKKKIDNIDTKTCYIMQLSQIPHISNVIAKEIALIYPTMEKLISSLKDCDDKIGILCNINKIGKEKARIIVEYLLP